MAPRALDYVSYQEYLASEHWQFVRRAAIWVAGGRCQVCKGEQDLEVHHASGYDCLFHEQPEDLAVLCRRCHELYSEAAVIG